MLHYHITIIGKNLNNKTFIQDLYYQHDVLLIEDNQTNLKYRNHIKTEDGYQLILIKNKNNIQITTDYFINLNIDKEQNMHKIPLASNMRVIDLARLFHSKALTNLEISPDIMRID